MSQSSLRKSHVSLNSALTITQNHHKHTNKPNNPATQDVECKPTTQCISLLQRATPYPINYHLHSATPCESGCLVATKHRPEQRHYHVHNTNDPRETT